MSRHEQLPYFDANDSCGMFQAMMPKDLSNIADGVSTYGGWEYLMHMDALFYDLWMVCSEPSGLGMGMCLGLIASTALTKIAFIPAIMYS